MSAGSPAAVAEIGRVGTAKVTALSADTIQIVESMLKEECIYYRRGSVDS